MQIKNTHTPAGLTDILVDECEIKYNLETTARQIFNQRGYRMVQPPSFEYYDVYDA